MVAGTENGNAGHVVQFHGHEEELADRVAGYLLETLDGCDAPAPRAVRTFAFSREAPASARHFAVDAAHRLGAADLADDAALVVTELAANAIVHAHSGFTVDLAARPDLLRISVRDASPVPPAPAGTALPAAPLHGLGAVAALARRWGVESLGPAGKAVWVELPRPPG